LGSVVGLDDELNQDVTLIAKAEVAKSCFGVLASGALGGM
jgi:hypothetical protein